ncbi:hypothetical protein [Neisseria canis]|uniref:hypothetical protein n=1 Tax=Neisseria canis TaxID=493 RepID=UPI001E4F8A58|nr:hypothetical protein [Neisseria canis]
MGGVEGEAFVAGSGNPAQRVVGVVFIAVVSVFGLNQIAVGIVMVTAFDQAFRLGGFAAGCFELYQLFFQTA